MGKGDRKTKKGKRFRNSYGVSRKRKKNPQKNPIKNMKCYMSNEELTKENKSLDFSCQWRIYIYCCAFNQQLH